MLLVLAVGGAKAYEPVYPALKTYDLSLDAANWTSGWNATAANDGDNLAITLTGDYGAKGIPLTETAATPLSSCNKICVVIESYSGGWGQLIAKSGGVDKAITGIGGVTAGSPKTFTLEYDPADNIDELDIQGGTGNPTITISRVYLVEKAERMPGTKRYTYDYNGIESFPWYHDDGWGTKPTVGDDILTATNEEAKGDASNYMFFVADNITTDENKEYYVRATIKGSVAGSIVCNLGTWGKSSEKSLSFTTEYQDVDILLSGVPTATGNHVIFKIGKYVGTISLKKIEVYEALGAKNITVGEAGVATFSSGDAFATSDIVKAYAAKYQDGHVVLTQVTEIPAGAGVIIEAAEGSYKVPVIESAAALSGNELQVSDGSVTGNESTIFVLNKVGDNVGFYKLESGKTLVAGKAYLEITDLSARGFIGIDGISPTGVNEVKVNKAVAKTGKIYNLNGQIVSKPTKGLYIVDGKVVSF